jgi:glycosyltransferase involved in cell wall biosynthesis
MNRVSARSSLGLGNDEFVYLIFGTVRTNKNYDRVIESFQRHHSEKDRLLVVIRRFDVNYIERSAFKRCQDLLARDNRGIISHFGLVPDEEVQRYFKAADVLLVPFTDNTSSATFMMTLTFAIPFISLENAFNRHVLPESCGIFIRSLDELPCAMRKMKDYDIHLMRREIAIRREKYSWDKVVVEHLKSYASILRAGSPTPEPAADYCEQPVGTRGHRRSGQ